MGRLDGKVALISGAARGMGEAEARLFAAEGAKVAVCDLRDDEGKAVADSIGENAIYQHLDVTNEDAWTEAVEATTRTFGGLTVLINNAGIAEAAPLVEMTLDSYRRVTDVNQTGVFLGMRAVIEPMTRAGNGSIINISSIDGLIGMDNIMSYVASKWAVRGMTKAAARELAPRGIRVNSIHPGFIYTHLAVEEESHLAMTHALLDKHTAKLAPMGRTGKPEEIAKLALFLASDDSSYSTGSEFVADGGLVAGYPSPGDSA
ncbi:MAG: 3-alpha-hydroxysteroid dehydrogenase [Deltaproteobacteria bacterium]|jgi:3alpha(or 20beta)-hydroxysteroid dehydrogenase|nr:3-alpha-hydroxysteroid dehydrogenase [Deltaproteobacteria bacterium]